MLSPNPIRFPYVYLTAEEFRENSRRSAGGQNIRKAFPPLLSLQRTTTKPATLMPSLSSKRLYLRGLSKDITEEELSKYLSCYGTITEVKLLPHYAFVQFESEKDAAQVLKTYQDQPLFGKHVVIEFAHPLRKDMASFSSSNGSESCRSPTYRASGRHPVVVLDIPNDVRWQELKDFGRLSGRLVAYCDLDKIQQGRGFIEYFTREDARRAVRVLDGQRLGGKSVRVVSHEKSISWRRCRSRSPERQPIFRYSRSYRHDSDYLAHRPGYIYPRHANEHDYDFGERRPFSSTPLYQSNSSFSPDERDFGSRLFLDNNDVGVPDPSTARTTTWAASSHHDYYHQSYEHTTSRHYADEVYYSDHRDSAFEGSATLRRDYHHFQRPMDPYQ
ncbi:unnamed protein product [Cyclocybe aegerita]|uniref:RRM domain-containing protein n=1 Tax=Cyclocybe aegerita TaxID=1973307 RepID=A0A8S0WVD6_CYCAE|nr:unnamed protein product [Cyclocybe aegerita]